MKKALLLLALIVGAVVTAAPLVWMVSASLMPGGEATAVPPRMFPSRVTFEHYAEMFSRLNLGRSFFNSMLLAVSITLISVLFNSMAGYAFARLRFRGRDRTFALLIAALAIPVPC